MDIRSNQVIFNSGKKVTKYTLSNDQGMSVEVLNLGGIITKIMVPDAEGNFENVVLEWEDINTYEQNPGNFGALIGRVAGRISEGKVTIEGETYHFAKNNGNNTLHGGLIGFDKKIWHEEETSIREQEAVLTLSYLSPDGEEGFPGNLKVKVSYILTNDNALTIKYEGETDKTTIVNLTNHAYFNLSGDAKRSVLEQEVYLNSKQLFMVDEGLIPDGNLISLDEEKPFDFRVPKTIGKDINTPNVLLKFGYGYDHVWLLDQNEDKRAAEFFDPISKRVMTVTTTNPAMVMYTMNHSDDATRLSNGNVQQARYAVCFEAQKAPVGYNELLKENILLKPGEKMLEVTTFTFSIR